MGTFDIPDEVAAALERGRQAYARGDVAAAQAADQEALTAAQRLGSAAGIVRAKRLLGLCAYRLGETADSETLLEEAAGAADTLGWEDEALLVANHLGATYRKRGRLGDADRVLRDGLRRAHPRRHAVARARLLGSLGAFLDDLGDDRAAAEHYARHEELLLGLDDRSRLANAHGLVSRAARKRGDLAAAEEKARAEIALGQSIAHPLREGRGRMHLAQALAEAGRGDEADAAFAEAEALIARAGDRRAPIGLATARARYFLGAGRLQEAFVAVEGARRALNELPAEEHEHRAQVSCAAAEVAGAAGLHGEALWHLGCALESYLARYQTIADPQLHHYTQARRAELLDLGARLLREAGTVERSGVEQERVERLLAALPGEPPPSPPSVESVVAWRERVRNESKRRWERLLGQAVGGLTEGDLVLADLVAGGPVGDLGRSLLLLFSTIERELGERVIHPLRRVTRASRPPNPSALHRIVWQRQPPGLGAIIDALLQPPDGLDAADARVELQKRLPDPACLVSLEPLRKKACAVDGNSDDTPTDVRNAIAHGREWANTRIAGDAVRRVLTLGPKAPLTTVLSLRLA